MRLAAIAFVLLVGGCTAKSNLDLQTAKVEKADVVQKVSLSGEIRAKRSTTISMPFTGYVKRLYVRVGQQVKTGDPLVSFSQTMTASEDLYPVRSSYPAIVSQVEHHEGDYVSDSSKDKAVVRIDDMSQVFVDIDVPESEMAKLKEKMVAVLRVNALPDQQWAGEVVELFRSSREKENSWERTGTAFPVRIEVKNPDPLLLPGMSSTVEITTKQSTGCLRIPQQYLLKDDKGTFVQVKGGRRPVTVGLRSDDFVEILSGVNEGESVEFSSPSTVEHQ